MHTEQNRVWRDYSNSWWCVASAAYMDKHTHWRTLSSHTTTAPTYPVHSPYHPTSHSAYCYQCLHTPYHPTQHTAIDACIHPTTPLSILLSMSACTLPPHSAYCYRCLHTPYHPTQHTAIDDCTHPTTSLSILLSTSAHTLPPHSAYCYRCLLAFPYLQQPLLPPRNDAGPAAGQVHGTAWCPLRTAAAAAVWRCRQQCRSPGGGCWPLAASLPSTAPCTSLPSVGESKQHRGGKLHSTLETFSPWQSLETSSVLVTVLHAMSCFGLAVRC